MANQWVDIKQQIITILHLQESYMMVVQHLQGHMHFQVRDIMINIVMEQVKQNIQEEN